MVLSSTLVQSVANRVTSGLMAIRNAFIDDDEKKDLKEGNKRQYRHDMLHTVLLPYPNHPEAAGSVFLPKIVEEFATYVKFNEDTGLPSYNNKAHGDAVNALFKKNLPDISLGRDANTIYKGIVIQSFLLLIFNTFINETRPDLLEVSMTSQMLLDRVPILQNMGLNEDELIRLCVLYHILLVFRLCVEKGTKEKCLLAGAMLIGSTRIEVLSATVKKAGAFAASCRHVYDYINPSDEMAVASPLLEARQNTSVGNSPPNGPAKRRSPFALPQQGNSVPFPSTSFALCDDEKLTSDAIDVLFLAFGDAEEAALPLVAADAAGGAAAGGDAAGAGAGADAGAGSLFSRVMAEQPHSSEDKFSRKRNSPCTPAPWQNEQKQQRLTSCLRNEENGDQGKENYSQPPFGLLSMT